MESHLTESLNILQPLSAICQITTFCGVSLVNALWACALIGYELRKVHVSACAFAVQNVEFHDSPLSREISLYALHFSDHLTMRFFYLWALRFSLPMAGGTSQSAAAQYRGDARGPKPSRMVPNAIQYLSQLLKGVGYEDVKGKDVKKSAPKPPNMYRVIM